MALPQNHPGKLNESIDVEISKLVGLAQNIMEYRQALNASLGETGSENTEAMTDILRVGTSAGGARPKAVIAINKQGHIRSGQVFGIMRSLKNLGMSDIEQQYKRIVFNVIARNQDDHTKNISFLMAPDGRWKLSPAYDVTYSYNPDGLWTNQHQMSLNGKRDHFTAHDLTLLGEVAGITDSQKIIHEVLGAVERWLEFAREAGVQKGQINAIASTHRGENINNFLE